eukprot:PhM_4_TR9758/c2_g1_i3/m.34471
MGVHDTVKLLDSISRLPGDTFVHTTLLTAVWERIHAQSRSMSIEEVSSVLLSISRLLHYQKNNNIQLNCNRLQESLFMNQHPSSSDGDAFTATELRTHASDLLSGISRLAGSLTIDPWLPIVQRLIEVMDPSKMKSDDSLYTAHPLVRLGVADAYLAEELLRNVRLSSGTNTAVELCMVLHTIMKARAPEKIVHSLNRDVLRVACELNHKNKQQTKHMTFVLFATGRTMKDFGPDEQKHAKLLLEDMLTRIHECSSKHVVGCLVACTRVDGIDRAMVSKFLRHTMRDVHLRGECAQYLHMSRGLTCVLRSTHDHSFHVCLTLLSRGSAPRWTWPCPSACIYDCAMLAVHPTSSPY